jgi:hypothetical protein
MNRGRENDQQQDNNLNFKTSKHRNRLTVLKEEEQQQKQ